MGDIYGRKSGAEKAQKKAQGFTKKMMLNKYQWESQDLELAGLNRILGFTGGAPIGGSPAPFSPSTAQDVASMGSGLKDTVTSGKGLSTARAERNIMKSKEAQEKTGESTARHLEKTAAQEVNTALAVNQKANADAKIAGSTITTAEEAAKQSVIETRFKESMIPAANAREQLDKTEMGKWLRYINRISRGVQGKDATTGN